jgi:hypothetical protein
MLSRITGPCIALVAVTLFAVSAQAAGPAGTPLSEEHRAALLEYDFSAELNAAVIDHDEFSYPRAKKDDPIEKQRQLNSLLINDKSRGIDDTVWSVIQWYRAHGDLPRDAVDLFDELQTEEGYAAFMAMSSQQRFDTYVSGVNRVTGRFHSTFYDSWNPGGITMVPDLGFKYPRVLRAGSRTLTFLPPVGVDEQFKYKVFGTTPHEVLWENMMGFSMGYPTEQPELMQKLATPDPTDG